MRKVANVLPVEEFRALRREGFSYREIAKKVGFDRSTLMRYAVEVLEPELWTARRREWRTTKRRTTKTARVMELLRNGWADRPMVEIAQEVGCSVSLVQVVRRRRWDGGLEVKDGRHCERCEFMGWERNPVGDDGLCLWCRLETQGFDLRELFENGEMRKILDRM